MYTCVYVEISIFRYLRNSKMYFSIKIIVGIMQVVDLQDFYCL